MRHWQADAGPLGWHANTGTLDAVAFSPDGTTLATGGFDKRIHLWNTATGVEVWHTEEHQTGLSHLLFSPDGKCLVSVDGSNWDSAGGFDVYLWDAATGTEVRRLKGSDKKIRDLAFSPNGKTLAVASDEEPIRLWETESRQLRGRLPAPNDFVYALAFSPDGRRVVVSQSRQPLHSWDVLTSQEAPTMGDPTGGLLAFAPDGRTLATSSGTSALIWPLSGAAAAPRDKGVLADEDREAAWNDLASTDAARAYRAIGVLAASQKDTPRFLQERLAESADAAKQAQRLIARLDNDDYAECERAETDLQRLGRTAETALRQASVDSTSAEVRMRVDKLTQLLKAEEEPVGGELRGLRALEVLEHIGDVPSRQALEALGERAPWFRVRQGARMGLKRLDELAAVP